MPKIMYPLCQLWIARVKSDQALELTQSPWSSKERTQWMRNNSNNSLRLLRDSMWRGRVWLDSLSKTDKTCLQWTLREKSKVLATKLYSLILTLLWKSSRSFITSNPSKFSNRSHQSSLKTLSMDLKLKPRRFLRSNRRWIQSSRS